jgi:hypothetical protein
VNDVTRTEENTASLDEIVGDALLTTYGYRKVAEVRGEFLIEKHRVVSNTLHTAEVLERDRSGQLSNPLNDCDEDESFEDHRASYGSDWDGA